MVKFIVICTKFLIAAIVALLFTSCNQVFNGIIGNGDVQVEKRIIKEKFTKIEANSGVEVVIEQGNDITVEVEADSNIIKHITTKVENGTLVVSTDASFYNTEAETVRVKMPVIEALEATSGSSIDTQKTIRGVNLVAKTSSGSGMELDVEYDKVSTESSSGSTLEVSGKAMKFNASSSSGSSIDAQSLLSNDVIAQATSGSSIDVHPLVSLNAKSSSGASIDYDGTPKNISKEETSGGSVSGR